MMSASVQSEAPPSEAVPSLALSEQNITRQLQENKSKTDAKEAVLLLKTKGGQQHPQGLNGGKDAKAVLTAATIGNGEGPLISRPVENACDIPTTNEAQGKVHADSNPFRLPENNMGGRATAGDRTGSSVAEIRSDDPPEAFDTVEEVQMIRQHLALPNTQLAASSKVPNKGSVQTAGAHTNEDDLHASMGSLDGAWSVRMDDDKIHLVGQASIGGELVVSNASEFYRLQWQRVERVMQADGSIKKYVEAIEGSDGEAKYCVAPEDEGCSIRIVASMKLSMSSTYEVCGRETPVVLARRKSTIIDMDLTEQSLNKMAHAIDGRRASRNLNHDKFRTKRRMGMSAPVMDKETMANKGDDLSDFDTEDTLGVAAELSKAQIDFLTKALSRHFLFTSVEVNVLMDVLKHITYLEVAAGSNIIEQGDTGYCFYILDSGEVEVLMQIEGGDTFKVVNVLRRGQCFGESVLMTRDLTRIATVKAVVDCGVWIIHRRVYEEKVLAKSAGCQVVEFLNKVEIFYHLAPAVVRGIASHCSTTDVAAGSIIFKQGDYSDTVYFVKEGRLSVIEDGREVAELGVRDAFGEGALISGKGRRTATVVTKTQATLLSLPSIIMTKLLPLGLDEVLDEKLAWEVLKHIPGFSSLTLQMLRDCGVSAGRHTQGPALRSITLDPGALLAEERRPADAIFIVKRGGLLVTTRKEQMLGTPPRKISEREYFGTTSTVAGGIYHHSATATEELTKVLRLPAKHMRILRAACDIAARADLLQTVPMLSTPSAQPLLKSLAGDSWSATFQEGTVIMGDGQQIDGKNFFLILSGFANLYRACQDTRQMRISARLGAGDYFGESALMEERDDEEPNISEETVVAVTDVECIIVSNSSFEAHMGAIREDMLCELSAMMQGVGDPIAMISKGLGGRLMAASSISKEDLVMHTTLGVGRFGRVCLVQHTKTEKVYALKQMARSAIVEAGQQSHVRNEVTVLKRINHPFCTRIFGTYVDKKYFYLLLDFVSGGELFRVLDRSPNGRLNNFASCFYAANVVCALEYLHSQHVIYRDVKPENLMIASDGFLKLTDFGFAKRVFGRTYTLCGTVDYLAPEIVTQQGHGFEVDLWALGVLAYEMLVGFPPFEAENKGDAHATYKKILAGDYTVPPLNLTPEASSFIGGLLTVDCISRLGCGRMGMTEVKMHPWFSGLDWDVLLERRLSPPFVPELVNSLDASNFDTYDEESDGIVEDFNVALEMLDTLFENF